MNAHYQYAMLEGYSNAASRTSLLPKEEEVADSITEVIKAPKEETETATKPFAPAPTKEEEPTYTTRPLTSPTTESTTTTTGDATIAPIKEGTTINIFNPDGATSSTTSSGGVSIDSETGEFDTEATDPNAGSLPSGGGGGGGGGGGAPSGGSGKGAKKVIQKTILPLIVIAAGIGVIILKPLK